MSLRVSIVIPTLNAERYLPGLLESFDAQVPSPPDEIVLVDSASDDRTPELAAAHPNVRVVGITREEFTHGYSRNLGVQEAAGELIVFLSQDARPTDEHWLAGITKPFEDAGTGAVFCRQIPYPEANPIERTFIEYWFPSQSRLTQGQPSNAKEDLRFLDVFFSNVSSAARRDVLLEHPFHVDIIMSEDQQFARDILHAGHDLVYTADASVWHSHDYTLRQIFQRYFDSAYSLTCIFNHTMKESAEAGRGYLPHEFKTIVTRYPIWIPYYLLYFLTKGTAVFAGHLAPHMPRRLARALSMHKRFWDIPEGTHGEGMTNDEIPKPE